MIISTEKDILRVIRWAPILFIIILSIIFTLIEIVDNDKILNHEIQKVKATFVRKNNNKSLEDVSRIYNYIEFTKKQSENNLKKILKQKVYEAHQIAINIYAENKSKSKKEILKLIKDALRNIRFNDGRGYYFMHDSFGNNQLYPLDKSLEGNNYAKLKDIKGYAFVQKIMRIIKNKTEGFDEYYWSKPVKEKMRIFKKIAFYKYFEPLNMTISTGEYLADFENDLKKDILTYLNYYNERNQDYIFIIDSYGEILAHHNKKIISKNIALTNKTFFMQLTEMLNNENTTSSYLDYVDNFNKNSNDEKRSYVQLFSQWNWFIGSGYYAKDLEVLILNKKIELDELRMQNIMNILRISFLATFILLFLTIYLSNMVRVKFVSYNKQLITQMHKSRQQDTVIAQQNKMASMGEMLSNIAHQWRQPLSMISTSSSGLMVKEEYGLLEKDDLKTSLSQITQTTTYLSKTIDDFRNFFKKDKNFKQINSIELWQKLDNLFGHHFKKNEIILHKQIDDFMFDALENELIQVIINILNNSKDHLLIRKVTKKLIFISIKKEEDSVCISIKDNAKGVSTQIINRILEPYFTTKHKYQGTGIGLYMCEQIICNSFKGHIRTENQKYLYEDVNYKGLETTLYFPLEKIKDI